MHVEVLESTMNFQGFFAPAALSIAGITSTKDSPNVNHVWRIVSRRSVPGHQGHVNWEVQNTKKEWDIWPEHDNDAILLCKAAMCAQKLSQMPLLVMPHGLAMHLDPKGLEVMPRNCFSNREAKVVLLIICS